MTNHKCNKTHYPQSSCKSIFHLLYIWSESLDLYFTVLFCSMNKEKTFIHKIFWMINQSILSDSFHLNNVKKKVKFYLEMWLFYDSDRIQMLNVSKVQSTRRNGLVIRVLDVWNWKCSAMDVDFDNKSVNKSCKQCINLCETICNWMICISKTIGQTLRGHMHIKTGMFLIRNHDKKKIRDISPHFEQGFCLKYQY